MKKQLFTFTACLLGLGSFSQQQLKARFDDDTEMSVDYFDEPSNLPKFEVLFPFFSFGSMNGLFMGPTINPKYRLNDKLMFDSKLMFPYSKALDESRNKDGGPTLVANATGHFELFEFTTTKNKPVNVGYVNGGTDRRGVTKVFIYKVPFDVYKRRALYVDVGIDYTSFANNHNFFHSESIDGINYEFELSKHNQKFTNVAYGFTYESSRSYRSIAAGQELSYFRINTWHFHFTRAVANGTQMTFMEKQTQGGTVIKDESRVVDLEDIATVTLGGVRFGYTYQMGTKNSGMALLFGFSAYLFPTYTLNDDVFAPARLMDLDPVAGGGFMIHSGLSFGTKPWGKKK